MRLVGAIESTLLRFDDGSPVRAASAIAPFAGGWLVAQDDATSAAWLSAGTTSRVRVLPPVDGHDVFSESAGTKHLKPDFEAALGPAADTDDVVLLLGSGSGAARTRACLVEHADGSVTTTVRDLEALYARIAAALGVTLDALNLEGACVADGTVRWFARGNPRAGIPSASVDLSVSSLLNAVRGHRPADSVEIGAVRPLDLGDVNGVALAVTDAVALPDGRVLVSAAAEDTPNAVDDGPVVGSALALLDGAEVLAVLPIPPVADRVAKIEGLAVRTLDRSGADLLAVVDDDAEGAPSTQLALRLAW